MARPEPVGEARAQSAPERRERILELVTHQGYCTILELSNALGVSDMTIRRDVQRLVGADRLRSVHGGVTILPQSALAGTDFGDRAARMAETKRRIAEKAAEYLPASGAVAFDAGTTTLEIARVVPPDARVHVVTPSLAVVNALVNHEHVAVTCLGGVFHRHSQSFAGQLTAAMIAELRVRTLFLAASGMTADGVYCGNDYDALTKRALVDVADSVVLVTDSSKFSISAMVRACTLDAVDRVVTDDGISEEHLRSLTDRDIDVVLVPAHTGD